MIKSAATLINRLKSSTFFKNTSVTFISSVAVRALNFVTFVMLARVLSVDDYGILTFLLVLISTLTDLLNSGLNSTLIRYTAIFKSRNEFDKISRLFSTSFINVTLFSICVIIGISVFSLPISRIFLKSDYHTLIMLSSVGVFSMFAFSIYGGILQGLERFSSYFVYYFVFALVKLLPILYMASAGTVSLGKIVTVFVVAPLFCIIAGEYLLKDIPRNWFIYDRAILKEMFGFGKWMMLWSVVAIAQSKLDIYLLAPLASRSEVSYFDIAQKFASIIMMGVGAYSTVLNPRLASLCADRLRVSKEVQRAVKVSVFISVCLAAGTFILPLFMQVLFGQKYVHSEIPLKIMLISLIPYVFTLPFNGALYAYGKSSVFFITALAGLVVNTVLSLLLVPRLGAIGSSFSYAAVNLVSFVCAYMFYRWYLANSEAPAHTTLSKDPLS